MSLSKKLIISVLTIVVLGTAVWYGGQYMRTGHFWKYLFPPTFTDVAPNPVRFPAGLTSYQKVDASSETLGLSGYTLTNIRSRTEEFKSRKLIETRAEVKDYDLDGILYVIDLVFYNDRLTYVSICGGDDAEKLFASLRVHEKIKIERYSPTIEGHLRINFRGGEKDCVIWNDTRLSDEALLFDQLTF